MSKNDIKEIAVVRAVPAVKEVPPITVKAINEKILDQLYPTRGELDDKPYNDLGPEWIVCGKLANSGDILCRNGNTGELRLCFSLRYARTKQDIKDPKTFNEFRKLLSDTIPTIYIA